jgi:competence protein ComEC
VSYGDFQILFTGDAEREVENYLIAQKLKLESEILKVALHGSNTASSRGFLEEVNSDFAVISVGRWNNYNLPSDEVIKRLQSNKSGVLETDEKGAIIVKSNGKRYWLKSLIE